MATIVNNEKKPEKRIRKNKGNFHIDGVEILDGDVKIFKTLASGDFWQCRIRVTKEKKYYRRSLRTKNLTEAKDKAKDIYLDIISKIRVGEPVFEQKLPELLEEYILDELKSVEYGEKKLSRVQTIKSQMKHFQAFIGKEQLSRIEPAYFRSYPQFRRKNHPSIKQVTIINESSSIKHFYKWAIKKGHVAPQLTPDFGRLPSSKKLGEKTTRKAVSDEEWGLITSYLRGWNKNIKDNNEKNTRLFIRYFILLLANTGLRFGEMRLLRWKDVEARETKDSKQDPLRMKLTIDVREGKTGALKVISKRGDILEKIKRFSKHTKQEDLIFTDNETGEAIVKDTYYKYWKLIMTDTKLINHIETPVFYSLRHTYATWKLHAGVDVFTLSELMGTSVQNISDHYGHIDLDKKSNLIMRDVKKDNDGQIIIN